jgi:phenylacetate-coenzyme A ligase PaaK-like adenylate-forming protein
MEAFDISARICRVHDPLHWTDEKCELMRHACREMAHFHQLHCPDIANLYARHGFDPSTLREEKDFERIPALGVTSMKSFLITSLPHDRAILKLTSSGTRGQKTQIWFDQASLDRCQSMMDAYWGQEGFVTSTPTNYLVFNYDPDDAGDLGVAFTDKNQLRFTPVARAWYALKKSAAGEWVFRKDEALEVLRDFARDGRPCRMFGLPSFIHEFLLHMRPEQYVSLPEGSLMITGGGWKSAENKAISKSAFRSLITERFGLPGHRVRDAYGLAECGAPFFECPEHRFHVAVYNRVIIRDPVTYEVNPPGVAGMMELVTPWNAMMPNLAVLTTDLGQIDATPCACGYRSPTFTLVGRAGLVKHKGCAIHANEIVTKR